MLRRLAEQEAHLLEALGEGVLARHDGRVPIAGVRSYGVPRGGGGRGIRSFGGGDVGGGGDGRAGEAGQLSGQWMVVSLGRA